MLLDKDFETRCQQVWLEAWVRTAQSDSCVKLETPTTYADRCLQDFRARFKAADQQPPEKQKA